MFLFVIFLESLFFDLIHIIVSPFHRADSLDVQVVHTGEVDISVTFTVATDISYFAV